MCTIWPLASLLPGLGSQSPWDSPVDAHGGQPQLEQVFGAMGEVEDDALGARVDPWPSKVVDKASQAEADEREGHERGDVELAVLFVDGVRGEHG